MRNLLLLLAIPLILVVSAVTAYFLFQQKSDNSPFTNIPDGFELERKNTHFRVYKDGEWVGNIEIISSSSVETIDQAKLSVDISAKSLCPAQIGSVNYGDSESIYCHTGNSISNKELGSWKELSVCSATYLYSSGERDTSACPSEHWLKTGNYLLVASAREESMLEILENIGIEE